ncbi:MAG: hypothetical protein JSS82_03735 [Bacteroidetes bacterium]|nr:hypothetical protein [Bacteroidota bacterium]
MNLKQWLAIIFSFATSINVFLAIDLYGDMLVMLAVSLLVSLTMACLVTRIDRVLAKKLRRWYAVRMYGVFHEEQ